MLSRKIYFNSSIQLSMKNNFVNTISNLEKSRLKTKKYEMSESHVSPFVRNITKEKELILSPEDPTVQSRMMTKN
jgi:hypothetical protein